MRTARFTYHAFALTLIVGLLVGCSAAPAAPPPAAAPTAAPAAGAAISPTKAPMPTYAPAEPTIAPAPAPTSPPAASDLASLVQAQFDQMSKGRIMYNPPEQMRLGQSEHVEVRITQEGEEVNLTENLEGRGAPRVENIPVTTFMKVRLIGQSFSVTPLSSEEQIVAGDSYTEWAWDITPKQAGDQILDLVVTARVKLAGYSDEQKDLQIIRRHIRVQVTPGAAVQTFIAANSGWLFPAVIIPLLVAVGGQAWRRIKRRKDKVAG